VVRAPELALVDPQVAREVRRVTSYFVIDCVVLATVTLVLQSWNTSERMLTSGGFESTQRVLSSTPVVDCSESGARWLGIAYWQAVNRVTRGGVRARWGNDAGSLTLLGAASLLSFSRRYFELLALRAGT